MERDAWPYAVNTYSYTFTHSAQACIEQQVARGFAHFEIMMYPGHCWPMAMSSADRIDLARLLRERDLRVGTLNMPNIDLNVSGATREMREYSCAILAQVIGLAGDLGVPGVIIGPGKANPLFPASLERLTGYFFEALDELMPLAERAGTRLLVENMPFAFLPDADGLMRVLDRYGTDAIGTVYDLANGFFIGEDVGSGLRRMKERLTLVHASDTGRAVYRHDPIGRGQVPFDQVPHVLREIGYAAPLVLEIISLRPDEDITDSIARLSSMGWPAARDVDPRKCSA